MKVPFTRRFGFELEYTSRGATQQKLAQAIKAAVPGQQVLVHNSHSRQNNNCRWVVKTDSSCGWEVASRVMLTAADLQKSVRAVRAMQRAGAKVDRRCGFHVHVEVADFTKDQVATMIQWWVKFERFITDVLDPSRKHNSYCTLVSSNFAGNRRYNTTDTIELNESCDRECALNTTIINWNHRPNSGYRRVEFRIAQGTNNFVDVQNWVRFLLTFVEFVKTAPRPENVNHLLPQEVLETLGLLPKCTSADTVEMRAWLLDSALKNAEDKHDRKLIKHIQKQISNR